MAYMILEDLRSQDVQSHFTKSYTKPHFLQLYNELQEPSSQPVFGT